MYRKNTGRELRVFFKDGTEVSGKLLQVLEGAVELEVAKTDGKKGEKETVTVPFEAIRESKVLISFKA
jgi:hypothetical protein